MNKATQLVIGSKVINSELEKDAYSASYLFNVYGRANSVLNLLRWGMGKKEGYTSEDLIQILEGILEQ